MVEKFNPQNRNPLVQGFDGFGSGIPDQRARLSPKPAAMNEILGNQAGGDNPGGTGWNMLAPLRPTNGLMWPYTPNIQTQTSINYSSYDPTHANQPFSAFNRGNAQEITVTGDFTAMNEDEARYSLAAIHFLRTVTKMYFGLREASAGRGGTSKRGTPPPILLFNAHGTAVFHNVPVLVINFNVDFPNNVDYVFVDMNGPGLNSMNQSTVAGGTPSVLNSSRSGQAGNVNFTKNDSSIKASAWVPTRFLLSATLQVQNTPRRWREGFNLDDFRTGRLITGGGWI